MLWEVTPASAATPRCGSSPTARATAGVRLGGGVAGCPDDPLGAEERGRAWWAGWMDGRFGELGSFVDNPNLAEWEAPSERLDYYRGHRVGSEARWDREN